MQPTPDQPDCLDERLCRWLWDLTDQLWLAEGSQLVMVGLRILLILLLALVLRWVAHRTVNRLMRRAAAVELSGFLPLPERFRVSMRESAGLASARRQQRANAIGSVLRSTATIAIFAVAGLMILGEFRINLAPLLAGAGIVGVALGFGAQSLVRDVLAGLFILMEDQYGIGDVVDLGEASGEVVGIALRITTLRDVRGVMWYVPNGEIRRVGNRSHTPATVVIDLPIGFVPVAEAVTVLRQAAQSMSEDPEFAGDLVAEPELVGVENITVEGAVYRTMVKTTPQSQWRVARELRRRQAEALVLAGLSEQILAARVYPREPGGGGTATAPGGGDGGDAG